MYEIRLPTEALRPYVENYWLVRPDRGPVDLSVNVFVDGRADLIFNFGAPYERTCLGGETRSIRCSNLDAQRLTPIQITQRGDVRVSGVRFRLGGLGAFVAPLRVWTGATPAPRDVFGADADRLERSLFESVDLDAHAPSTMPSSSSARTSGGRTRRSRVPSRRSWPTRPCPSRRWPKWRTSRRATSSASSPRHLGIAPKTLARVVRFQTALRMLMKDPGVPLATVAADAGYFDQAHFVRDFKRMSGGVPRGYRGYFPPEGPSDFAPNVVVFVQDDPRS